jgi:hypothetical protein
MKELGAKICLHNPVREFLQTACKQEPSECAEHIFVLQCKSDAVYEEDGYYLIADEFQQLSDSGEVLKKANKLIKALQGIAYVHLDYNEPIEVHGALQIDDQGNKHMFIHLSSSISVRSRVTATATVYVDGKEVERSENPVANLLVAANKSAEVADALSFLTEPIWFNLYKVYEIIRDDLGGERMLEKKAWANKKDIKRFTQSAQSREQLGDQARHASKKYRPADNPMFLDEAKGMVKNLVISWSTEKLK